MCCDNPTDLGCFSSCGNIILPIASTVDYTVKTSFNGSVFEVDFALNQSNYLVLDKTNLNEGYTYTFGVYNASGTIVGCYKLKIHPTAICCGDELVSTTNVLADYACFNSDDFLGTFVGSGNQYGYECIAAKYNGEQVDTGSIQWFNNVATQQVPIQVSPRDTIPFHNTDDPGGDHLSYDANWIDFLKSLPIANKLTFRTSPYTEGVSITKNINGGNYTQQRADINYPYQIFGNTSHNPLDANANTYGEGFQIESVKGSNWAFTIKCWYRVGSDDNTAVIGHTVIYRDDSYTVDGATIYPANKREIQSV